MAAISKNSELEGLCSQKKFSLERGVLALKLSKLSKVEETSFKVTGLSFQLPAQKLKYFWNKDAKTKNIHFCQTTRR